ncbi:MAG: hypothetical protein JO027_06520 [Solirubrobacterales bacterium]|nr:hypothetical protein [Solirubrobacterales bacterium]
MIPSSHPTFIAFYPDAARAARIELALSRDDAREPVSLERRGAVTIAWSQAPAGHERDLVWSCLA